MHIYLWTDLRNLVFERGLGFEVASFFRPQIAKFEGRQDNRIYRHEGTKVAVEEKSEIRSTQFETNSNDRNRKFKTKNLP